MAREGGAGREELVAEVCRLMEDNLDTWKIRRDIQAEISKSGTGPAELRQTVKTIMEAKGLATRLTNSAFTLGERMAAEGRSPVTKSPGQPPPASRAPVDCEPTATSIPPRALEEVAAAQAAWQELVVQRLNEYRVRADMPLARRQRTEAELQELRSGGLPRPSERIGDPDAEYGYLPVPEALLARHIYGTDDLYRALCSMSGTDPSTGERSGRPVAAANKLAALEWGAVTLALPTPSVAELQARFRELHPRQRQVGLDDELFEWFEDERTQAADRAVGEGSIPACRRLARAGVPPGSRPRLWATALCIPPTMFTDVSHFEALCAEVENRQLLTDYLVAADVEANIAPRRTTFSRRHGQGRPPARHLPPSAVLPFAGLALLAGPLCYLYEEAAQLYHAFRALYCRHWCRLHSFAVDPAGRPAGAPRAGRASAAPSRALLQEVLLLWDRVVGREILLAAERYEEVKDVMDDLSQMKVAPLLQGLMVLRPGAAGAAAQELLLRALDA
eukprot:jgi/Tetstr1/462576/TSEL_007562.t1